MYCDRCGPTQGIEPPTASRQASVVTKQVWTFSPDRGLEQRMLPKSAPSVLIDDVWLPRWYVGPKRERSPFAVIYAAKAPNAALLRQVAMEATERFEVEPWMAERR